MSILIRLAADFIEKMSNPANGPLVNEEYSLLFSELTGEEGFHQSLTREIERIRNPEELTSYGWLWLIKWCRVNDVRLSYTLTIELMKRWSNVFMQAAIIDLVTHNDTEPVFRYVEGRLTISNTWISDIVQMCTAVKNTENQEGEDLNPKNINTAQAENLLVALLQVGSTVTIAGAQYLLQHDWPGKERVLYFFRQRLGRLDEETRTAWLQQIESRRF